MPSEEVYYGDDSVWVTSQRLVFDGWEEPLRHAGEARVQVIPEKDRTSSFYGLMLIYLVWLVVLWLNVSYPNPGGALLPNLIFVCIGVFLLGTLIAGTVRRNKGATATIYAVSVKYRFWRYIVAASTDPAYAERVATAIQYAIARRDNGPFEIIAPSGSGSAAKIPSPRINGNVVYTDQSEYDLAEVATVTVSRMTGVSWTQWIVPSFLLLMQLVTLGQKYFSDMNWLVQAAATVVGVAGIIALVATVFLIPVTIRSPRDVQTVELKLRTGSNVVIFASTDKRNAEQVQASIQEEMQEDGQDNQAVKQA